MTTSKSINSRLAGLSGKLPVLLLSTLLAACGGGGGGGKDGGGGGSSSSSSSSSSSGNPGGSSSGSSTSSSGGSSTSSSSGGGETKPGEPTLAMEPQATKTFQFSWEPVSGASEYRLLENPDGVSGYKQIASVDGETSEYGLVVFLPEKVNASYMLQACNSSGCADSDPVDVEASALTSAIGYLKAPTPGPSDEFGSLALSADGSTLAIGAYDDTGGDINGPSIGAVYVFTQDRGNWRQQAYLNAPNPDRSDLFGLSVSLSADGNILAVGAFGEDSASIDAPTDNSVSFSGAAYVFTRSGNGWEHSAYLKASNIGENDQFGRSLALSADGSTLAIGAIYEDGSITGTGTGAGDNNDSEGLGAVYVFVYQDNTWQQQAYLKPAIESYSDSDAFGHSLSISGDGSTLAVGMPFQNAFNRGAAFVFSRSGDTWQQDAYLTATVRDTLDQFGNIVALSGDGNTLAVGAENDDSGIAGDPTDNSAENSGAAYIFRKESGIWNQTDFLKGSNTEAGDCFSVQGLALSEGGALLAVAAACEDSIAVGINGDQQNNSAENSGAVYLFRYLDGEWQQKSYLKAPNTDAGDSFGGDLALSADGKVLAVTSFYEASASGEQDDNSSEFGTGAVYLY